MQLFRPFDNVFVETVANFTAHDPIIPYGVFAVNADGSGFKLGDGVNVWSALSYQGGNSIGSKQVQTSREPANNELVIFCDSTDKWIYRLQHCFDTVTNWESSTSVFPTCTMLIETADLTGIPTGRFKIGDGDTSFDTLPWFGADFATSDFSVGESIEFNGTYFEPVTYLKPTELQSATTPTGLFHRDDGTWAAMSGDYVSGPSSVLDGDIVVFDGTTGKVLKSSGISYSEILFASTGTPHESFQIHGGVTLVDNNSNLYVTDSSGTVTNIYADSLYANLSSVATLLVGSFPSELTSVSLTSPDGVYLYVDGGKVFTSLTDGHNSGLDADTLDGYHATSFATITHTHDIASDSASGFLPLLENTTTKYLRDDGTWQTVTGSGAGDVTGPATSVIGNIVTFNSTDGKSISDSEYDVSDFATADHTHAIYVTEDDALAYSIAFGG